MYKKEKGKINEKTPHLNKKLKYKLSSDRDKIVPPIFAHGSIGLEFHYSEIVECLKSY